VAIANLTVARTASMFGVHSSGSEGAFPPKRDYPSLSLSVLTCTFGVDFTRG
jgi:hypothetical protein